MWHRLFVFSFLALCAPLAAQAANYPPDSYYETLRRGCEHPRTGLIGFLFGPEKDSCCLSSVGDMEHGGFRLAPPQGCPPDEKGDMLRCITTYKWCEEKRSSEGH